MQLIRCTQKLLKEIAVKPTEVEPEVEGLGDWHANLLRFERRKCVLFTNSLTLYSMFVPGLKQPDFKDLYEVFRQALFRRLRLEGFSQVPIERVLEEYGTLYCAKTNSRSVLGTMNDLAFQIEIHIKMSGGLAYTDLDKLNNELNRVPRSAINYNYSIEMLTEILS